MPTPAEKKALLFLTSVALLGVSVRALRAVGTIDKLAPANAQAIENQLAAVDSARRAKQGKGSGRGRGGAPPKSGRHRLPPDSLPGRDTGDVHRPPNGKGVAALRGTKIDVDLATAEQLDALPGVGPVLARRIIVDRQK